MSTTRVRLAALAMAGVLSLAGCAGSGDTAAEPETSSSPSPTEEEINPQAQEKCVTAIDPLLTELSALDSRLGSGLQFERYTDLVADAQIPYDALLADVENAETLDDFGGQYCITDVAEPLERALKRYTEAGNRWNECFTNFDCVVDEDALPEMQEKWTRAEERIEEARAALADYGTSSS